MGCRWCGLLFFFGSTFASLFDSLLARLIFQLIFPSNPQSMGLVTVMAVDLLVMRATPATPEHSPALRIGESFSDILSDS